MKQAVKTSLGLGLLFLATACGGAGAAKSGTSLMEDTKVVLREVTAILATMQDEASAEAATEKLEAWTDRAKDLKAREEALSPHESNVMREGDDELNALRGALDKEAMRLSLNEDLAPYIVEAYALFDQ